MTGLHNEKEQRDGTNVQVLRASLPYVQDPLEHTGNFHHITQFQSISGSVASLVPTPTPVIQILTPAAANHPRESFL